MLKFEHNDTSQCQIAFDLATSEKGEFNTPTEYMKNGGFDCFQNRRLAATINIDMLCFAGIKPLLPSDCL